jgi:hypothetical protein
VDLIATSTEIIIADITAFEKLVRHNDNFKFSCNFKNVQNLRIMAKLRTRALAAIEQKNQTSTRDPTRETTQRNDDPEAVAWERLSSTLAHLPALRTLRVWLDRSESDYWTTINETAIIAPLRPLADREQLDVCIELPRHYNDDTTTFPFKVTRRLRQRTFGFTDSLGRIRTSRRADFPMMEACHFPVEGLSTAELEGAERHFWREGLDVQHEIIDGGVWHHHGLI